MGLQLMDLADIAPVAECEGIPDPAEFAAIRAEEQPVVIRGLVSEWPLVTAGREGGEQVVRYLSERGRDRPVAAIAAAPQEGGRFFYTPDMRGLNFVRGKGRLDAFLADLLKVADADDPPAMAIQSVEAGELIPGFSQENPLDLLPEVAPRIWIGNRIRVAAHYDVKENIACCVAGRRRFTLFPPDQIRNLYPGPFELTPAGTPVSLVDLNRPDLEAHPRFEEAWAHARQTTLEPGDAIYIPYCWWHGVESLDPVSILVNYWWSDGVPEGNGGHYDALLHAILSFRHLPPAQKRVWRDMLDYYVFSDEDSAAHLPDHAKGIQGPSDPRLFARMREIIRAALGPGAGPT